MPSAGRLAGTALDRALGMQKLWISIHMLCIFFFLMSLLAQPCLCSSRGEGNGGGSAEGCPGRARVGVTPCVCV